MMATGFELPLRKRSDRDVQGPQWGPDSNGNLLRFTTIKANSKSVVLLDLVERNTARGGKFAITCCHKPGAGRQTGTFSLSRTGMGIAPNVTGSGPDNPGDLSICSNTRP